MNNNFTNAVNAALEHLSDRQNRVRSDLVDDIAYFKSILRGIASGQLVIASPEKIIPEGIELPKKESDPEVNNLGDN